MSSTKSVDYIQRALARSDGPEEMWVSLKRIGSFSKTRISIEKKSNDAIKACETDGQRHQGFNFCETRMHEAVQRNLVAYSAAMNACEEGEQWHQASDLLGRILCAELQSSIIIYSAAIMACESLLELRQ